MEKDTIKIGIAHQTEQFTSYYWRHLGCFKVTKKYKNVDPDQIKGI
jgi:hypothetical protein